MQISETPWVDAHENRLNGQPKPTPEQVAWVIAHLCDHAIQGGSFRVMIYSRMGYEQQEYPALCCAGGLALSNILNTISAYGLNGERRG